MKLKITEFLCLLSIMIGPILGLAIGAIITNNIFGIEAGQKISILELGIMLVIILIPFCIGAILSFYLGFYFWFKITCTYLPKSTVIKVSQKVLNTEQYESRMKFINWVSNKN